MSKRPAHAEAAISPDMPADVVRQEFARRLQRAMIEKGWTQSELARRASSHTPDNRMIRDNVSKYIRGKVLPGPLHLNALAKALNKKPDELLPTRGTPAAGQENPPMDIRDLRDGNAWVRVNQALPWDTAMQIAKLLHGK
jgi:transcriptional regulator with XRE-family HTH domain